MEYSNQASHLMSKRPLLDKRQDGIYEKTFNRRFQAVRLGRAKLSKNSVAALTTMDGPAGVS